MQQTQPSNTIDDQRVLQFLCESQHPVEIHREMPSGQVLTGKTRFMGSDDGVLYLAIPHCNGDKWRAGAGTRVDCYFKHDRSLFTFTSSIVNPATLVPLNEQKMVTGISIKAPRQIRSGQRRNAYRVSLALVPNAAAECHTLKDADIGIAKLDAERFTVRISNLSEGGVGLMLEAPAHLPVKVGDRFMIGFKLPGEDFQFMYVASVQRAEPIKDNTATKLGIQFVAWPDRRTFGRQQQMLGRVLRKLQLAQAPARDD